LINQQYRKPDVKQPAKSTILFVGIFWLSLIILICRGLVARFFTQDTDSAFYFSLLNPNPGRSNLDQEFNNSFFSLIRLINRERNGIDVSSADLLSNPSVPLYENHAYFLTYLLNFINGSIFSNFYFPFLLLSGSFVWGLSQIFYFLYKDNCLKIKIVIPFFILVLFSPIFYSSLNGQLYIDRLAFGPIIYVLIRILENRTRDIVFLKILVVSIFAFSLSERVSLSLGLAILISIIRSKKFDKTQKLKIASIGLLGISWYFYWLVFVGNSFYASSTDLSTLLRNFNEAMNGSRTLNLGIFVLVLLPLLILSLATLRGTILVCSAIGPNVLITLGGAELTGFSTHYHSLYFPILIVTSAVGLNRIIRIKVQLNKIVIPIVIFTLFSLSLLSISASNRAEQNSPLRNFEISLGRLGEAFGFTTSERARFQSVHRDFVMRFPTHVGSNSVVAPPELMPALAAQRKRNLTFFPIGLGREQFVIASYLGDNFATPYFDTYGLVPPFLIEKWGPMIQAVLVSSYTEVFRSKSESANRTYIVFKLRD
jgi:hypothetical protein